MEIEYTVIEKKKGDWSRRIIWGEGCKRGVKEEIWGGTTNAMGHLRGNMETYYCRNILKYTYVLKKSKWNHKITGESILASHLFHQVKPPVP